MAETTIATSAPSAAPASSPAPSSAPASTSTPSTPATQTPASTSPDTSAAPKSIEQQLSEKMLAGLESKDAAAASEPVAEPEVKAEEAIEVPEPEPEPEVAEEEEESEETADEETDLEELGEIELDAPLGLGPKDLAAKLDSAPEVKALLEQHPELRDQMFANARLADQAKAYREILGSPAEAAVVAEGHQVYTGIRDVMGNVQDGDPKSTQAVISAMLAQATLRDANGEVLTDESGQPITDGTIGRFLKNTFQMRLGMIEQQAKAEGNDEVLAALDTIMERAGLRAPSSASEDGMSEELKAQRAQIDQERRQLDDRKASEQQQTQAAHSERVFGRIDTVLDKQLASILDRSTGLTPFARAGAEAAIRKNLAQALKKSSAFQAELDLIERMPVGKERAQKHIATATRYINDHLLHVARPILSEAGATVTKAAAAKEQQRAARAEAAQSEIKGSSPAPKAQPVNPADVTRQVTEELAAKLGRKPSMEEVLVAKMNRGLAAANAR